MLLLWLPTVGAVTLLAYGFGGGDFAPPEFEEFGFWDWVDLAPFLAWVISPFVFAPFGFRRHPRTTGKPREGVPS